MPSVEQATAGRKGRTRRERVGLVVKATLGAFVALFVPGAGFTFAIGSAADRLLVGGVESWPSPLMVGAAVGGAASALALLVTSALMVRTGSAARVYAADVEVHQWPGSVA